LAAKDLAAISIPIPAGWRAIVLPNRGLMNENRVSTPLDSSLGGPPGRWQVPAWILSAGLHAVILLILGFSLSSRPHGTASEPTRQVGIALVRQTAERREYFDESNSSDPSTSDSSPADAAAEFSPQSDAAPLDPSEFLPERGPLGPGALESAGVGDARDAAKGGPASKSVGGAAKTSLFGVEGEGFKFLYVFDRSMSMSEPDDRPMAAAKAELIASLESLDRVHQFQIIFFNHEEPRVFNPSGKPDRLAFADDASKQAARDFLAKISADGATRPEPALNLAVRMRPDVIFFLTDGEDLDYAMIDRITRANRSRATIHAIQFGVGKRKPSSLLTELAEQNGGRCAYVDTSQLSLDHGRR
jgi:hypothetical protein